MVELENKKIVKITYRRFSNAPTDSHVVIESKNDKDFIFSRTAKEYI